MMPSSLGIPPRALAQLQEAMSGDAALVTAPEEFMVDTAVRMIDAITSEPHTWRPILLAPSGTPEVVRERIERDREQVRRQVERLLEVGLALRGGPHVDVEVASTPWSPSSSTSAGCCWTTRDASRPTDSSPRFGAC